MRILTQPGQSYFDIAMQYYGDAAYAVNIAELNNNSINNIGVGFTEDLDADTPLELPVIALTASQQRVVDFFAKRENKPAGQNPS